MPPFERLRTYRDAVDAELREVFDGREGLLYRILRYHLGWADEHGAATDEVPALHIQGATTLACCEALGGHLESALPAAAAVELVHQFTLVHGEVQAGRSQMVDRPGIWWVWGPAQAINAGDGLHALGRTAMMRLARSGTSPERVLRAVRSLDLACLRLCEGQYMDLAFQDQLLVTDSAYIDMVQRKAGALTGTAAEAGALAAGADDQLSDALHSFGVNFGAAWQISQDARDFWGDHGDALTAANVIAKRKTLPVVHALEHGSIAAKRKMGEIYAKRVLEPDDVSCLISILDDTGARAATTQRYNQFAQQALSAAAAAGIAGNDLALLQQVTDWALAGNN